LNDILIGKLGYIPPLNLGLGIHVGNTFACKFSRNKNNLHIVGVASEYGEIIVQNTLAYYNEHNKQIKRSKFNNKLHTLLF